MGASGSIVGSTLKAASAEEIGELVGGMGKGEAYERYKEAVIEHGISGQMLVTSNEEEIIEILQALGVSNVIHMKVIKSHLLNVLGLAAGGSSTSNLHRNNTTTPHQKQHDIKEGSDKKIMLSPRAILTTIFSIQGIDIDPSDLSTSLASLESVIPRGYGDGITSFDVFLSYRVAADALLVERIYLFLKSKGIHAFWDKESLKKGQGWKEGFVSGLRNSNKFIAVLSSAALEKLRNQTANHSEDNMMIEFQIALQIQQTQDNADFIVPLFVGRNEGSTLTKFRDFNPNLYSEYIIPPTVVVATTPTLSTVKAVTTPVKAVALANPVKVSIVTETYEYLGEVCDGKRHGKGVCKYKAAHVGYVYDGEWKNDKFNGRGVYKYPDGRVYDGEWKDGLKNGHGVFKFANGNVYDGEWKDDKKNGHGVFKYADGDVYDGEWKYDKKNGHGVYKFPDGRVYDGEWKDSRKNGHGVFKFANGNEYDGEWKDDKYNGHGVYKYADGNVYDGEWKDGKKWSLSK